VQASTSKPQPSPALDPGFILKKAVISAAVACTPIRIFDRLVSGMVSVTG